MERKEREVGVDLAASFGSVDTRGGGSSRETSHLSFIYSTGQNREYTKHHI